MIQPIRRALLAGLLVLGPGAGMAQVDDHLECFRIKDDRRFRGTVDVTTPEFGKHNNCKLSKALMLCIPAQKDDEEIVDEAGLPVTPLPIPGPPLGSVLCYKMRCPKPLGALPDQTVTDQFGAHTLSRLKPQLVCTPLESPTTTSTTTTTSTSTSTTTSTFAPF